MRPSLAVASIKPSTVVSNLLVSRIRKRCLSIGCLVLANSQSRLSASVVKPVFIFLVFGRSKSSKRTACNCFGEPTLNSFPASLWAPLVSRSTSPLKKAESSRNLSKSTPIPVFSMSANSTNTGISISFIRADISRSEISLLNSGTNFIIEIAPSPSN